MNYLSFCNAFLLVVFAFCASQIKCNDDEYFALPFDLFLNPCMIRHFGPTSNNTALISVIEAAPFSKAVDAFIDCPALMCEAYCRKTCLDRSNAFIIHLRESTSGEKLSQFFRALRTFPIVRTLNRRDLTRDYIVASSIMLDVPYEHFLHAVKKDYNFYIMIIEKASRCKTPEAKSSIIRLLNNLLIELEQGPNYQEFKHMLKLTITMVSNEPINIDSFDPEARTGLVFLSLSYDRYDIAEQVVSTSVPVDLNSITKFMEEKTPSDIPRAVEILKQLLINEADRNNFEALFRTETN